MSIPSLIYAKWHSPALPKVSFANKTILVTGANVGLGFEAAQHFVSMNAARVILAVRSIAKGEAARELMETNTGRKGVIDVMHLDMGSFQSVRDFAQKIEKEVPRLDIAVLNAGVITKDYGISSEGWEQTLTVNTLSTTLLAILLLPKMRSSGKTSTSTKEGKDLPHLVIVASATHHKIKRSDLPAKGNILQGLSSRNPPSYNFQHQYALSKLLVMYAARQLATIATSPSGQAEVIVTSCCPGACRSTLARGFDDWYWKLAAFLFALVLQKTTEEGSRNYVGAAALGVEAQGGYWNEGVLKQPSNLITSKEGQAIQQQVWGEIIDTLRVKVPEVERLAARPK